MKLVNRYFFEFLLIAIVMALSVTGFWKIYFGIGSDPNPHHHLHLAANFIWLFLLLFQLCLIATNKHAYHRQVGLSVLVFGPLLVATTALLSVYSAHKGLISGKGDFLIVQNVMGTLELGLIILLAFVVRRRRTLHGSFLLSTTILFMGIALFFSLISFVPAFEISGPETFHRFASAAMTGQLICMIVGVLFFIKDFRNGWPFLLVSLFFVINELIRSFLSERNLIQPLTEYVGSMSQPLTFVFSFTALSALLAGTGILNSPTRPGGDGPVTAATTRLSAVHEVARCEP